MTTDWAQIQTMLYLRLLLISFDLVLVLADHKEDEPQETNYYGSPTRGGLPIVAQPIQQEQEHLTDTLLAELKGRAT